MKPINQMTPMMQQYWQIKEQYPDAFLFFRLGDFYELFFEDARRASEILGLTLTRRGVVGEAPVPMCGVPHHAADAYVQQLIEKGYHVAICEQVEDPKSAKNVVKREVVQVITPGTWLGGKEIEAANRYICALGGENDGYALAAADLSTGLLEVSATPLTLEGAFDECMRYDPNELLLCEDWRDEMQARFVKQYRHCITMVQAVSLAEGEKLVSDWIRNAPLLTHLQLKVTGQLLSYLEETQKRRLIHFSLQTVERSQYLILDAFTRRNLELFERLQGGKKEGALLHYLDRTLTTMGTRELKRWLNQPLIRKQEIDERIDAVEAFVNDALLREEVRGALKQVYDLERIAGRVAYGNVTPKDLLSLKQSLYQVPAFKRLLVANEAPVLKEMAWQMDECVEICNLIERAIDDEASVQFKEGRVIREGYHEQLDQFRRISKSGKNWIARLELQERQETGIRSLKVGYNKVFGYYIEVSKPNLPLIPEGRYERKQTLANAERFVTRELKEQEQRIVEAEEKMTELEQALFQEIREEIASEIARIKKVAALIAVLDVLSALGELSVKEHLVRPQFTEERRIEIIEGRHPVVASMLEGAEFVTNDTVMDEQRQILLITGPNMAGKSTYMRQVALIAIMAQMGCFVPAKRAVLPIFDRLFTRIGAADDLTGGQSTFMMEMSEIRVTTTYATKNSLVIIDELGRGTSTEDGMAIAQAVIEYLHQRVGCLALVSTHYHELAELECALKGLKNVSMAVQESQDEVLFLRRLVDGAASKSYGIYCAKLAGLPEEIVLRAEGLLDAHIRQSKELTANISDHNHECNSEINALSHAQLEVLQMLESADLINMTPMQAMTLLYEIKQKGGWQIV